MMLLLIWGQRRPPAGKAAERSGFIFFIHENSICPGRYHDPGLKLLFSPGCHTRD